MWIRSQDRKLLTKVNAILIANGSRVFIDCHILGTYSTQEKALKVLDEIQKRIEYPEASLISPTALRNYYRLSSVGHFYQMPADDEV